MRHTRPMVTGLFSDRSSAEAAHTAGDMNLVMSDDIRRTHFTGTTAGKETVLGNQAAEGAGIGGTIDTIAAAINWCTGRLEHA